MKNLIALLVCLTSVACSSRLMPKKNLRYYAEINKAELAIVADDNQQALRHYKKAFSLADGWADDYYNALKLSVSLRDTAFSLQNAKALRKRGLCLEFFTRLEMFRDNADLTTELRNTTATIDFGYKEKINKLHDKDQLAHQQHIRELKHKTTQENYVDFLHYYEQQGYPSATKIGLQCTPNMLGYFVPPENILFTHFAMEKLENLDKKLLIFLREQHLAPHEFADYYDLFDDKRPYAFSLVVRIDNQLYRTKLSAKQEQEINALRKKIGFHSIDDQLRKTAYALKNTNSGYRLNCLVDTYSELPEENIAKYLVKLNW
ncbi:MAG: hypothetical protein KA974_01050 [Saprospiraceae bacterium]|nr:hypothetical protein [Saprospiraceae bacterium]MBP7679483.1 hypothetical protein [Saprospiraceae bacterium]